MCVYIPAYSEGFCRKNGRKQATNEEMNRAISQAVAYSRKKNKETLDNPKIVTANCNGCHQKQQ